MNIFEFNKLITELKECENFLEGRNSAAHIKEIADNSAKEAIIAYRKSLFAKLKAQGLVLEEE